MAITVKKKSSRTKNKKTDKKLVIVESPAKTKTLAKFLGKEYRIESSKGHLIDLPKSSMGVDVDNKFEPRYITIRGKGSILSDLKKAAKSCSEILLATDPDREGEAISWHLEQAFLSLNKNVKRIEFNEITEDAVLEAVRTPRAIDTSKVNSQQARRILDRLVGYSISPLLQEKFGSKHFSAGRVQSVTLKLICEREDQIDKFNPIEYWEFFAGFNSDSQKKNQDKLDFQLAQIDRKKVLISNGTEAQAHEENINQATFNCTSRIVRERKVNPPEPFITSRLQQDSANRLGFRAQKTMSLAQKLYEGVEMGDGTVGLITYMRTDSKRISDSGLQMARVYIAENYDKEYLPETSNVYDKGNKKQTQDAHEAIRPTSVKRTPEMMSRYLGKDELKLYTLIWSRFVGSQMTAGKDETITLNVDGEHKQTYTFKISGSATKFPGFRKVYNQAGGKKSNPVPNFKANEKLALVRLDKKQKFTQPPPRFSESGLIRAMEETGIGRPATYASTLGTLDKRAYIERRGRQLAPTTLGKVVNMMLVKHFPDIVNIQFTAEMEEKLDEIASGDVEWRSMLQAFYVPFQSEMKKASETMEEQKHYAREPLGRECPDCGNELYKKLGKNGYFIGCSNFIGGCRYTESIPFGECPVCEPGKVVKKKSQKGRVFYACSEYQNTSCEFVMLEPPAKRTCPRCNSIMSQKVKKSGATLTCQNAKCGFQFVENAEVEPELEQSIDA